MILQMIRYEVKMHWRRRALLVIALSNLVLIIVSALLVDNDETQDLMNSIDDHELTVDVTTIFIMLVTWMPIAFTTLLILPIALSDTIPLERQRGTAELLNSTPLTTMQFLLGKLLGAWVSVWLIFPPLMLISGIVWKIQFGAYDLLRYSTMWLISLPLLVILNGSIGILLPALFTHRRQAIALVAALLIGLMIFAGPNFRTEQAMTLHDYLHPGRSPMVLYYLTQSSSQLSDAILSVALGLLELTGLFVVMWFVLQRRESTL